MADDEEDYGGEEFDEGADEDYVADRDKHSFLASGVIGTRIGSLPARLQKMHDGIVELIEEFPQHDWRSVAGANHYTVLIGEDGAAAVARALLDAVNSPR